ncbi:MAG TPA: MATE family efflux transporter [Deltaproteobacteria bacterium]|nr:MATE family efflux transporter [Deltaproteobacteria bacterium]
MTRNFQLTTDPIPRLIRDISIPASIGFFFNTMFNVVDTYFAGVISTQALAALSLSFPVFFILISMGSGVSTGTTALIATALGAGDTPQAKVFAVQGVSFGVILSAAITAIGILASPYLFSFMGAQGPYLAMCLAYMNTIFAGSVFFVLNYMLNAILYALGDTRSFRDFLIVGCLLNAVFDPWFIFGGLGVPAMGVMGIALATVVIQLMGTIYLGYKVMRTELACDLCFSEAVPRPQAFLEIARQGFPTSLNSITVGVGIFVITSFISVFGKEAVAAYGVATRVEQIMLLPTIGLNIATVTIVAQNNGARRYERIFETVRTALRYGAVFMAFGTVALLIFAGKLMGLFTTDAQVVAIGTFYLRISAFILYAYVVLYVNVAALQGVKRPGYGLVIGVVRQIALPLMIFPSFIHVLGLGIAGIWWGIFVITWSAAGITFFYARAGLKRMLDAKA